MDDPIESADEIKKAEFRENLKQALIRLLDDPQVQKKIALLVQKQLRPLRRLRIFGQRDKLKANRSKGA
jgi:hypothetical protein